MTGAKAPASVADQVEGPLEELDAPARRGRRGRSCEIVSDISPNHIDRMCSSSAEHVAPAGASAPAGRRARRLGEVEVGEQAGDPVGLDRGRISSRWKARSWAPRSGSRSRLTSTTTSDAERDPHPEGRPPAERVDEDARQRDAEQAADRAPELVATHHPGPVGDRVVVGHERARPPGRWPRRCRRPGG